jgi:hypothetical protein
MALARMVFASAKQIGIQNQAHQNAPFTATRQLLVAETDIATRQPANVFAQAVLGVIVVQGQMDVVVPTPVMKIGVAVIGVLAVVVLKAELAMMLTDAEQKTANQM